MVNKKSEVDDDADLEGLSRWDLETALTLLDLRGGGLGFFGEVGSRSLVVSLPDEIE